MISLNTVKMKNAKFYYVLNSQLIKYMALKWQV
jgi:hypothetical protein